MVGSIFMLLIYRSRWVLFAQSFLFLALALELRLELAPLFAHF
jgi:hypothetical protein